MTLKAMTIDIDFFLHLPRVAETLRWGFPAGTLPATYTPQQEEKKT